MNRCVWAGKSTKHKTPWGHEIRWTGLLTGKELHITKGGRTSLKFYKMKSEVLLIAAGTVIAEVADECHWTDPVQCPVRKIVLNKGDFLNVQAGCPYRLFATEDSIVYEICEGSTSECVRLADDYDRSIDEAAAQSYIFRPPNDEEWKT